MLTITINKTDFKTADAWHYFLHQILKIQEDTNKISKVILHDIPKESIECIIGSWNNEKQNNE